MAAPFGGIPRGSGSTTKSGRLSFALPSAYETQLPALGKPGSTKPVFCMNVAGPWTFDFDISEMKERDVVHASRRMRQQVADPLAALAVLLPAPRARHHHTGVALEQLDLFAGIQLLAGMLDQSRLVVERVALARGAGHE